MKRYIRSATNSKYTISRSRLNKATVYCDNISLINFTDCDVKSFDRYSPQSIEMYLRHQKNRLNNDISVDDLKVVDANYIIDTQGHLDLVQLQDGETLDNMPEITSLHDAFVSLADDIESSFQSIDSYTSQDPLVAGIQLTVKLYGYQKDSITFVSNVLLLNGGTKNFADTYDYTLSAINSSEDLEISLSDITKDNTYFNRVFLRNLRRELAQSLDRPSTSVTSATNLMHKTFIIPEFQIAQAFGNYLDTHNIQYDAWNETGNYYIECDITFNELFGINNFLLQFGKIEMAGDKTLRLVVKNSSKFRR